MAFLSDKELYYTEHLLLGIVLNVLLALPKLAKVVLSL